MTPEEKQAADTALATKALADKASAEAAAKAEAAKATQYEARDFKLPDGSPMKPEDIEGIVTFSKARGLSRDVTQAYIDFEHAESLKDVEHDKAEQVKLGEKQKRALEETKARMAKELLDDPEFGAGDPIKFRDNAELAKRGALKVFGEEFVKFADATGIGSLPGFVKGMRQLGRLIADDRLRLGGSTSESKDKKSDAELFYLENAR